MVENPTVKLVGSLGREWIEILGTDTVHIDPPIPQTVELPDGSSLMTYFMDLNKLTDNQKLRSIQYLAGKFSLPIENIKEQLDSNGLFLPEEACVMPRITEKQVNMMREIVRDYYEERHRTRHIPYDAQLEAYSLSVKILAMMMGHNWWTQNIVTMISESEPRLAYLRPGLRDEQQRHESMDRMIDLADSLFLLQYCEGFESRLEKLGELSRERPEVILEDIAIELNVAKRIFRNGHSIKFIKRSGVKGNDFDLEIKFNNRAEIYAEVKCKREDMPVNVNSLRRVLYDAEKQLSGATPSVVFVRLPTKWVRDTDFVSQIDRVIHNYFRNILHVNAVVFVWEERVEASGNRKANLQKFKLMLHPSPALPVDNLEKQLIVPMSSYPQTTGTFLSLSFGRFVDS